MQAIVSSPFLSCKSSTYLIRLDWFLEPHQGNDETAVKRFFERSNARLSERDVRAMLERHLTSDAADRLLSQVPFGDIVGPLEEAGLLDDDRAIFWSCCMCFVEPFEPATEGSPTGKTAAGPFLRGVADAAKATPLEWRWRRWWDWEKLKIEVRLFSMICDWLSISQSIKRSVSQLVGQSINQ